MDLDDLDGPRQAPSRVTRFAPKSFKPKPKPKSEPAAKLDLQEPVQELETEPPASKPEPQESRESQKKEETYVAPKTEHLALNGSVKMEVDQAELKTEAKKEPVEDVPMEEEESEDTVVREIDVFFNPNIDTDSKIYVFQYPLRPSWRPYELDERCEEVRLRPSSSEVQVDLTMDVDSKNYDQETGRRLEMTKQTLSCSWKPQCTTGYAVGLMMDNKLYLNPIHAVAQLRPSLEYLNASGSKRKNNVAGVAEDVVKQEESGVKKPAGLLKKQNKQVDSSKEQKSMTVEDWVPLKYHGSDSEVSSKYKQRMVLQENSPLQFTMTPYDYMNSLCPISSNNDNKPKGSSRRSLLLLPLEERMKKLICEGSTVQRFSGLKHFAPDSTAEEILDVLRHHALLVQGLWTPKSNLLYPGQESGAQRIARDYVLLLFCKSPFISSSSLHFPPSLKNAVNKFLNTFAVERSTVKDWKFKEPTDTSFMKLYPSIVKEQEEIWGEIEKQIMSLLGKDGKSRSGAKNASVASKPERPLNSNKVVTKSPSGAFSGKSIPDDVREVLSSKVLPEVLHEHKVCSFQLICQGLRDLALKKRNLPKADTRFVAAADFGADNPDELRKLIDQVAISIHGLYALKTSPENPQYDPLRNVVIDLLRQSGPSAKLKKADVMDAAKTALKRGINDKEYNKVMNELCVFKGSMWMLKSGDGNPS